MSKTLQKHPKVDEVEIEGGGYFIYLEYGWCFDQVGCHCFSEATVKDALASLGRCFRCGCQSCTEGLVRINAIERA